MNTSSTCLQAQLLSRLKYFKANFPSITQAEIARHCNVDEANFSAAIAGRKGLSADSVLRLHRLFNLSKRDVLQVLKSAREDHRRQVDALLKSEARILHLEVQRGSLVDIDACKSLISSCLVPTIIWMRKLADAARNPEERALLESLREAGLLTINASAKEAANFNAKEALAA